MNRLNLALALADKSYRVFPLAPGSKFPLKGSHGSHDATTDHNQIAQWWTDNPAANIAIATDGLLVVDCDPEPDGPNRWEQLHAADLETSASAITRTPRGRHYVYAAPLFPVKSSTGMEDKSIAPRVDVKTGAGSYVVGPGSFVNGKQYIAVAELPDREELEPPPDWLCALLKESNGERNGKPKATTPATPDDPIPEGTRNDTLTSLAGTLRRQVFVQTAIEAALLATNKARCVPPLDSDEVAAIARSVARYEVDQTAQSVAEDWAGQNKRNAPPEPPRPITPFVPFPTDSLPSPIREYVESVSNSIRCCPSFVVLPMLACLAAAVGASRSLRLKPDWVVPAILWTATVGESGSAKSPAFRAATLFVRDRQRLAVRKFEQATAEHLAAVEKYEAALEAYENAEEPKGDAPEPPVPPVFERVLVSDVTTEAIGPVLLENPRGVILWRDELSGWIGSLDRYAKTRGGDEPAFLSMYGGESLSIDRRTGTPRYLHVPAAYLSICGTIQPAVLARTMGRERRDSGLLARFLLACPPRRRKEWSDDSVPEELRDRVRDVFDGLYALEPARDSTGDEYPAPIRVADDALDEFKAYFRRNAERLDTASGDEAAALSKLEETAARLALVVHLARQAAGDDVEPWECDRGSMLAGVTLGEWFCRETARVYAVLAESSTTTGKRRLVDWISQHGGNVAVRDVAAGCRWLRKPGQAERALESLVENGTGRWQESPPNGTGRPPGRRFVLVTPDDPEFC